MVPGQSSRIRLMDPDVKAFAAFRAGAADRLAQSKSVLDFKKVAVEGLKKIDRAFQDGLTATGTSIACKSGCFYCCYLKVDVHAHEVFPIVDYIRKTKSPERVSQIVNEAAANMERIAPMTLNEHFAANLRCPLLEADSTCGVYPVRPAGCRTKHSLNVQPCEDSYNDPSDLNSPLGDDPNLKAVMDSAVAGIVAAWDAAGFDVRAYDLNRALFEGLTSSHAESRWKSGKKAFSSAALAKMS